MRGFSGGTLPNFFAKRPRVTCRRSSQPSGSMKANACDEPMPARMLAMVASARFQHLLECFVPGRVCLQSVGPVVRVDVVLAGFRQGVVRHPVALNRRQ